MSRSEKKDVATKVHLPSCYSLLFFFPWRHLGSSWITKQHNPIFAFVSDVPVSSRQDSKLYFLQKNSEKKLIGRKPLMTTLSGREGTHSKNFRWTGSIFATLQKKKYFFVQTIRVFWYWICLWRQSFVDVPYIFEELSSNPHMDCFLLSTHSLLQMFQILSYK